MIEAILKQIIKPEVIYMKDAENGDLKLYVWKDVLCGYNCGMVVALAHSEEEAWDMLHDRDIDAWCELMFGDDKNWYDEEIIEIKNRYKNLNLAELREKWLEEHNIRIYEKATRPIVVTKPSLFLVWGGD